MDVSKNCKKRGFHDHEQGTPLYTTLHHFSLRSRHAVFKDLDFEIVDKK